MEEHLMKIGEIAAFFNVSVKAVRIYEKKGIIRPARIDKQTGYRYYTADQVQQLNALIELKGLGFSLNEIREIMQGKGMDNRRLAECLLQKKMRWKESISAAENKISELDSIIQRLSGSRDTAEMSEMTEEERAWYLVKMVCVEDLRAQSLLSEALWL